MACFKIPYNGERGQVLLVGRKVGSRNIVSGSGPESGGCNYCKSTGKWGGRQAFKTDKQK